MRLPWCTLALAVCAIGASFDAGLGGWLIYDRHAIAGGELWRLVTGQLVHFSASHLAANLCVIGVAGWVLEARREVAVPALYVGSAVLIGIALYVLDPALGVYGGSSGLACAAIGYVAMCQIERAGVSRVLGIALLAVLSAKLWAEIAWGLRVVSGDEFVPVPLSHLAGAGSALLLYALARRRRLMSAFRPGRTRSGSIGRPA